MSLLALICIASVIGTVLKQNEPAVNYVNQFGPFWAALFAALGLNAVYSAWWFLLILAFLVLSTSLCIARNTPKIFVDLRAYKENIRAQSLQAFHHKAQAELPESAQAAARRMFTLLAGAGWKVRLQQRGSAAGLDASPDASSGWMVAAKAGAANKLGYLAAHSAIVLVCLGGLLDGELIVRAQMLLGGKTPYQGGGLIADVGPEHRLSLRNPSFRGNLLVAEGTQSGTAVLSQPDGVLLQELPFAIELKKFIVEHYSTGMPKLFASEIVIHDEYGRERERHKVPYGATLTVNADQNVKAGTVLAKWEPLTRPIITEFAGRTKFENVEEGLTVARQLDEVTGLSTLVVIDPKRRGAAKVVRPQVKLIDAQGNEVKIPGTDHSVTIGFQVGALIQVRDGQDVGPGEVLARIPVEGQKTRDITGGLPRVAELFEARTPKDKGTLAEMTGTVSFGKETKGKVRLQITDPEGHVFEELVPKEKNILVHEGQVVNKGESIVDGPADPQDILRLLGIEELSRYIVDEVQDVYRLQGVKINDKHIEVIVRQMLRRVVVEDAGESNYISGEQVERSEILNTNEALRAAGKIPAVYSNLLLGITKASLSTDSFISAASFQETTRVLTEAAIMGKRDELRGLKENVIVGRLIPAGTGLAYHQARKAKDAMDDAERRAIADAEAAEMAAQAEVPELGGSSVTASDAAAD
ncbi:hypothetical protein ET532_013140 [Verminephrobacter sp. Larva24]|nr:hypothetical protein ET532_013140 [Verminephrobacter sp. Larva24]